MLMDWICQLAKAGRDIGKDIRRVRGTLLSERELAQHGTCAGHKFSFSCAQSDRQSGLPLGKQLQGYPSFVLSELGIARRSEDGSAALSPYRGTRAAGCGLGIHTGWNSAGASCFACSVRVEGAVVQCGIAFDVLLF